MYNVDYNDKRFKDVETEKQSELNKYNETYDNLINERNNFTKEQQDMIDRWETTQKDIANNNLQYQKDLIEQQRKKSEQAYQNEAKASYIDYQKEVDKYGVSRENVVNNGLSNSGYAESSKVDMYNTYQNRLGTARKSMQDAGIEFDNAIRQAQLQNNETLAQNALKALQEKLNIALEGFNYKSEQENNKLNWNNTINNNYYNRYKDVESQINYENETAEKIRQYNEQMEYQKEQQRLEQQRWEKEYALQQAQATAQNNYYSSLTDGDNNSNNDISLNDNDSNKTTRYSSKTAVVKALIAAGGKDVTTATDFNKLVSEGYIGVETINGEVFYYINSIPKSGWDNSKKTSKTTGNSSNNASSKKSKGILGTLSKLIQFV